MKIKEAVVDILIIYFWMGLLFTTLLAWDTWQAWEVALDSQARWVIPPDNSHLHEAQERGCHLVFNERWECIQ